MRGGPELGELEAGAVANWFGAPFAVITGGLGCLIATGWLAASTPEIRRYRAEPAPTLKAVGAGSEEQDPAYDRP